MERKLDKILIVLIFLLIGIIIGALISFYTTPYKIFPNNAPGDYINESQIHLTNNSVCIDIENPSMSSYASTNSMVPSLNENTNGIRIVPKSRDEINIGDIVTYERQKCIDNNCTKSELVIHRVISKGIDMEGFYFILKGDNNVLNDKKVRWNQIKFKTIMLVF